MRTGYVTLYNWDWQSIGQVAIDLSCLERNGEIDRAELDDAAQKAARPLLEGKDIKDVHIFVHEGDHAPPEVLQKVARQEYMKRGPDSVSWDRNRRIKRPGPIDSKSPEKGDLKQKSFLPECDE